MSLINDALKRARKAQQQQNNPPRASGAGMEPVENVPGSGSPLIGILIIAVGLAGGAWLIWELTKKSPAPPEVPHTEVASVEPAVQTFPETVAPVVEAEMPPPEPAPAPPPAAPVLAELPSAPATPASAPEVPAEAAAAVEPAEPVVPTFPQLTLQGIFFRLKGPTVLINDTHANVGDKVEGATVIEIERQSVLVEWNGERRVLRMSR